MRSFQSLKSRPDVLSNRQSIEPTQSTELPPKEKRDIIQDSINEEENYQSDDTCYEDDTSSTHSTRKPTIGANVTLRLLLSGKRQQHQQLQLQKTTCKRASTRGLKEFFQISRSILTENKKKQRQTVSALFVTQVKWLVLCFSLRIVN